MAEATGSTGASADAALSWLHTADRRALDHRAKAENFPVASLLFTRAQRTDVAAVYAVARLIDEAGDTAPGDRLAVLDALEEDLLRLPLATLPVVAALAPAVRRGLPVEPLRDLIGANRLDQRKTAYCTRAELRDYCRLSAEPIGRLVLSLLDLTTPQRVAWSDEVCAGLQVAEHLQDVGEDLAAGRVYLPADAMARHGVDPLALEAVAAGTASEAVRASVAALLAGQVDWARTLLSAGRPLVRSLHGRPRLAVAAFVAGGLAALDAVLDAGADAVTTTPRPRRSRVVRHLASVAVTVEL